MNHRHATIVANEVAELQERLASTTHEIIGLQGQVAFLESQLAQYRKALEEINRRCGEATRASRRDVWPDILYIFDEVKKALR